MGQIDPQAVQMRGPVEDLLADLAQIADRNDDVALRLTVDALQRVHALYPGYDDMALRGTPERQFRIAVHNEIVAAINAHYESLVLDGHDALPA